MNLQYLEIVKQFLSASQAWIPPNGIIIKPLGKDNLDLNHTACLMHLTNTDELTAEMFYGCRVQILFLYRTHSSSTSLLYSLYSFYCILLYPLCRYTCLFTYEISTPYDSQLPRCRIIPYELTKALRLFVHNCFKISRDLLCTFKPCHHIKHPHNLTILLLQSPNADPVIFCK